ncbi:hypothetical protein TWF594_006066 [Orbilia oligospora]|nr:hypothetical protein TWF103_000096 [Orbilia oligospora]KAF3141514.1 hypothetical protein TWF594_006066 [Orbilia oligospora]
MGNQSKQKGAFRSCAGLGRNPISQLQYCISVVWEKRLQPASTKTTTPTQSSICHHPHPQYRELFSFINFLKHYLGRNPFPQSIVFLFVLRHLRIARVSL